MSGRKGPNKTMHYQESPITAIGSDITLVSLDQVKPHCFAGVQFFSDSAGATPIVPSAGIVTIEIKTINTNLFEPVLGGIIDVRSPTTVSWAANTKEIKAIPSGITVVAYYKLVVTYNET